MMTEGLPTVSVVIPTHNRSASLRRTLDALCVQTYPFQQLEVVVVADGCVDDTLAMLSHYQAPFPVRAIAQASQGQAVARNCGATHANGRLLLFLDDDIEATPHLIEAHVHAQLRGSHQVTIGYLPLVLQDPLDFFHMRLRTWWEDKARAMR